MEPKVRYSSVGSVGFLDECDVAVEDPSLSHTVAAYLQREVLAGREHVGRHVDDEQA